MSYKEGKKKDNIILKRRRTEPRRCSFHLPLIFDQRSTITQAKNGVEISKHYNDVRNGRARIITLGMDNARKKKK